jgi:hypothetical protein
VSISLKSPKKVSRFDLLGTDWFEHGRFDAQQIVKTREVQSKRARHFISALAASAQLNKELSSLVGVVVCLVGANSAEQEQLYLRRLREVFEQISSTAT